MESKMKALHMVALLSVLTMLAACSNYGGESSYGNDRTGTYSSSDSNGGAGGNGGGGY